MARCAWCNGGGGGSGVREVSRPSVLMRPMPDCAISENCVFFARFFHLCSLCFLLFKFFPMRELSRFGIGVAQPFWLRPCGAGLPALCLGSFMPPPQSRSIVPNRDIFHESTRQNASICVNPRDLRANAFSYFSFQLSQFLISNRAQSCLIVLILWRSGRRRTRPPRGARCIAASGWFCRLPKAGCLLWDALWEETCSRKLADFEAGPEMKYRWLLPDAALRAPAAALAAALGVSPLLAQCLVNRGMSGPDEAARFLRPRLKDLADPLLLPNMAAAVQRLLLARAARREPLVIFGDYDVDGVTSTRPACWKRSARWAGLSIIICRIGWMRVTD